tara:strand:+ start:6623 stop:7747 length:1125 start_codon:yes stop_codon:yes gene_type:complete
MSKEENLDLSKVTVSQLLDDQQIPESTDPKQEEKPVENTTEEVVEETQEESVPEQETTDEETVEEVKEEQTEEAEQPVAENTESDETDSEPSIVSTLIERLGYDIQGEFSDDYDGIVGVTKEAATKMAEEQFQQVFSAFPDIQEYLNYRVSGGDPDKYFEVAAKEIDFSKLEVNEKDVGMQRKILETFLTSQGYEPEEVTDTIQDYEDAKILYKNAGRAVKKLAVAQANAKETLLKQQQEEAKVVAQQTKETWNNINQIVNKGKLKDFTIPEADKKKFYNWMSVPVDQQGRSQRIIDREKLDQESILAMEYLMYKGLDLSKLINTKATTRQAVNLKAKLKANSQTASRRMKGNKGGYNKTSKRPNIPSLDKLLG